jgi:hypothetical protein
LYKKWGLDRAHDDKFRAEYIAKGVAKNKMETTLVMLSDDIPLETISKYTGLSVDEIKSLKTQ